MFDTRIKRELASCRQERDQLQNILKALSQSMALIEFSPEGRILDANPLFLRVVGYRLEELQGQPHSLLCRSELSNSPAYGQFWQRLARGESISDKFPRLTKQGQDIWLEARTSGWRPATFRYAMLRARCTRSSNWPRTLPNASRRPSDYAT